MAAARVPSGHLLPSHRLAGMCQVTKDFISFSHTPPGWRVGAAQVAAQVAAQLAAAGRSKAGTFILKPVKIVIDVNGRKRVHACNLLCNILWTATTTSPAG